MDEELKVANLIIRELSQENAKLRLQVLDMAARTALKEGVDDETND